MSTIESMMIPSSQVEIPCTEDKTQTQIMMEILSAVSRVEGMLLAQNRPTQSQGVQVGAGSPIVSSAQFDFPPVMF